MADSNRSVNRAAIIMFLYALVVVALSALAYLIAPPGANAMTAVVAGGVSAVLMCVMAGMSLLIRKNRAVGMIGIHVGMLLPLLFCVGFLMRIPVAYGEAGVFRFFDAEFERQVEAGALQDNADARAKFYADAERALTGDETEIPRTDKTYLGRTLTLLFGASTAAFVLLLLSRPKVPAKEADPFAADTPLQTKHDAKESTKTSDFTS
ncbi:MAG: hypothetical protein AAFR76_06190 [Planctomycetota bacterium]